MRVPAVALAALLLLPAACKKPEGAGAEPAAAESNAAPVRVTTAAVTEQLMPELLVLTGSLKASQESEVAADASGKVTATLVERGQHVNKGDTLAILDARGAAITATAMAAQSGLARAQQEQAQRECERTKLLFDTGAISKAEFDRTATQCQTSQFSVAAAQAQQQSAQKLVGDAVIRAPFAGVVGERFVNVGQYVQPTTRIVSLYDPDPLRLELTVPEANVAAMKADLPITFTVATFGDQGFKGALKFISPNVRPSTRDLVVEALCPNPDGKLKPGMFAVASLAAGEKKLAAVPLAAVKKEESSARVFVVAEKRIQERLVQLGGEKDGFVAVLAGVKPGESVVTSPGPDVRDGAPVAN